MRVTLPTFVVLLAALLVKLTAADEAPDATAWRSLPLVRDGKIDPAWTHLWGGGFVVTNEGAVRTACTDEGMGLLLYTKEKIGNCQIRVVFRAQDSKSNSGVYVRIDDDVLKHRDDPLPRRERNVNGILTPESLKRLQESSETEKESWYPVHHGYEIQICESGDDHHRTGAIYSLTMGQSVPVKDPNAWRTMMITLLGNTITVDVDGMRVTTFTPDSMHFRERKNWYEPKREPQRPNVGYIGLQNHDPGDVVDFKEVSVRALTDAQVQRNGPLPVEDYEFTGTVVNPEGKPVADATIEGAYASFQAASLNFTAKTDGNGKFTVRRQVQPAMVHVQSKDKTLGAIVRVEHDEQSKTFELKSTTSAVGILLDSEGAAMPEAKVDYGFRVYQGDENSPFTKKFGGAVKTDADGRYKLLALVPGVEYRATVQQGRLGLHVASITPQSSARVDLGKTRLPKPEHVPSVSGLSSARKALEDHIASAFQNTKPLPDRLETAKAEGRREYLRLAIYVADPNSKAAQWLYSRIRGSGKDDKVATEIRSARNDYQHMWVDAALEQELRTLTRTNAASAWKAPCVLLLDTEGKYLDHLSLSTNREGSYSSEPLRDLLVRHQLPRRDAEQLLKAALEQAARENKRVFIHETASWCGPCRMLSRFIDGHREIFDANYVWVKNDRERQESGEAVMKRLRSGPVRSIPWVAILDAREKVLGATGKYDEEKYEDGNYGFPTEPDEIDHFLNLLKSTGPRMSEEGLQTLRTDLSERT